MSPHVFFFLVSLSDSADFQVKKFALSYPFYSHPHQAPALLSVMLKSELSSLHFSKFLQLKLSQQTHAGVWGSRGLFGQILGCCERVIHCVPVFLTLIILKDTCVNWRKRLQFNFFCRRGIKWTLCKIGYSKELHFSSVPLMIHLLFFLQSWKVKCFLTITFSKYYGKID